MRLARSMGPQTKPTAGRRMGGVGKTQNPKLYSSKNDVASDDFVLPLINVPKIGQHLLQLVLREYQSSFNKAKSSGGMLENHRGIWHKIQNWVEVLSEGSSVGNLVRSSQYQTELRQILSELGIHNNPEVLQAIQQDEAHTSVVMREVLDSPESKQEVLKLVDENMEQFMNLLQFLLERSANGLGDHEGLAQRLLLNLAKASGKLPSSLFISNVEDVAAQNAARGGFAEIYRARYQGMGVALKKPHFYHTVDRQKYHKMLCREVVVWRGLNNPNILPFLGLDADTFPGFFCLVSPWMQNGTLNDHIRKHPPVQHNMNRWVSEIVQGVQYLHGRHIVHGDLRGANIFIDDQWNVRIADFGLSHFADATLTTLGLSGKGSVRWMAPERLFPKKFGRSNSIPTYASDVYAFACTCIEIFSLAPPFSDIDHDPTLFLELVDGHCPARPHQEKCEVTYDYLTLLSHLKCVIKTIKTVSDDKVVLGMS